MKKLLFLLMAMGWPAFQALQAQSSLSQVDERTLVFLTEEEKLARDVYLAMEAKWGAKVFNHIAEAEQRHLGRAIELATAKGVRLPKSITEGNAGKFHDKNLQKFYDELTASGNTSLEAALRAGARIEETDIRDLKMALEATDDESLRTAYQYFIDASGNHLRAFNKNLAAQGATYSPVLLPQSDFDAIVGDEGGGQGMGQGSKGQAGKGCCRNEGGKQGQCCQGGQKGKQRPSAN